MCILLIDSEKQNTCLYETSIGWPEFPLALKQTCFCRDIAACAMMNFQKPTIYIPDPEIWSSSLGPNCPLISWLKTWTCFWKSQALQGWRGQDQPAAYRGKVQNSGSVMVWATFAHMASWVICMTDAWYIQVLEQHMVKRRFCMYYNSVPKALNSLSAKLACLQAWPVTQGKAQQWRPQVQTYIIKNGKTVHF